MRTELGSIVSVINWNSTFPRDAFIVVRLVLIKASFLTPPIAL